VLNYSIVVGYQESGVMNVNGGIITSPDLKVGISSGAVGTYSQTSGNVTVGDFCVGNDDTMNGGMGNGVATLSGGILNVTNLYLGSAAGGIGTLTITGNGQLNIAGLFEDWGTQGSGLNLQGGGFTVGSTMNSAAINQTAGNANLGALSGGGTITIGNPVGSTASTMTLSALQQSSALVNKNGMLTLNGSVTPVFNNIGSLHINAGGLLVVNGLRNTLTINYGNNADPNSTIRKYLQNGFNGGHWDAGGTLPNSAFGSIASTMAAGNSAYAIGYADGSDGAVNGLAGGFEEMKFTYGGDASLDGQVNLTDLSILASHFGNTTAQWDQADFSYDGTVNLTDLSILASHFGDGVGNTLDDARVHVQFGEDLAMVEASDPAFASEVSRLVPEPSSLTLLAIGGMGLLKRRRRINH
jgi:hypothetical protein